MATTPLLYWLRARLADNERGGHLMEYVMLVALIAVVAIAAVQLLGEDVSTTFSGVASQVD